MSLGKCKNLHSQQILQNFNFKLFFVLYNVMKRLY